MAHVHEDSDTYYLDQLCLIALSGAFGGVCLSLSFWLTGMRDLMLAPQFHGWLAASGIALVTLALLRAVILWRAVGQTRAHHHHDHEHTHDSHHHHHDHDHAHEHAIVAAAPGQAILPPGQGLVVNP